MASIGSFKGNATLTLNPDSKYPFRFGLGKARLIVDHFDSIAAFVASNGTSTDTAPAEAEMSEDAAPEIAAAPSFAEPKKQEQGSILDLLGN